VSDAGWLFDDFVNAEMRKVLVSQPEDRDQREEAYRRARVATEMKAGLENLIETYEADSALVAKRLERLKERREQHRRIWGGCQPRTRDDAIQNPGHRGAGCESLRCGSQSSQEKRPARALVRRAAAGCRSRIGGRPNVLRSFPLLASANSGVDRHSAMPNRKFAQQHRVHTC
jgi:hypothetical protein